MSYHVRFLSKWTPKLFVLFSSSVVSLLCINLHLSGWLRLCLLSRCIDENSMHFVSSSLKTKLFCKAQSDTVCRSDSNFSIQFCRFFNLQCWYNVVSSAYCKELQLMLSTVSTIYKLKSTGPNTLICGTRKLLSWVDEVLSSICTYYRYSEIWLWINFMASTEKFILQSFWSKERWSIVPNVLEKSNRIPRVTSLVFIARIMSSLSFSKRVLVECPLRKPDWVRL